MTVRKRRRRRTRRRLRSRWLWGGALFAGLALGLVLGWLVWPFWQLSAQFEDRLELEPSRLWSRPTRLEVGRRADFDAIVAEIRDQGYRPVPSSTPAPGQYRAAAGRLAVRLRPHASAAGRSPGGLLEARWSGSRVAGLRYRGAVVESVELEPVLIRTYWGPERRERRQVELSEVPESLVYAILAAEDESFFDHPGVSLAGIARAAWVNLRGGATLQGGSTLTQQLVKNLFLTHERTLGRKVREVILAVMLDWRFEKRDILRAYINEIYLGSSAGANLIGVGAASWAYFGKRPAELELCESALLAGIIPAPGRYAPGVDRLAALERRNHVLRRMGELGWLERGALEAALAEPLCHQPRGLGGNVARYFADAAAEEAERRWGVDPRHQPGLDLIATLRLTDQKLAEEAILWGLARLEESWEKGVRATGPLQAALVSLEPASGEILAYVGGRDYGASQFDRVSLASRQAGSAFKPVVYAAALERGVVTPASFLEDAPMTVALAGNSWSPQNSDGRFHGTVTARAALERSLNVATARVAMSVGLSEVVAMARRLGIGGRLREYPSLALGAFEVTPLELATVYATLAAGGRRPTPRALAAVVDAQGRRLVGEDPPRPQAALSPQTAFILTSMLQGVLERGTGASARRMGLADALAGKTGTTNERRDSWFAGYSPDRTTLVWVGYDDNSPTRLSGARAALPVWVRFTRQVRPAGGFPVFSQPPGVTTALIDAESGWLATGDCAEVLTEVFLAGTAPQQICRLHRFEERLAEGGREPRRRWRWLRRIFGRDGGERRRP